MSNTEIRIEPRQPNRLEKKKNMPGIPLQTAGGSVRISNSGNQVKAGIARVWTVRPNSSCRSSGYGSFVRKAPLPDLQTWLLEWALLSRTLALPGMFKPRDTKS